MSSRGDQWDDDGPCDSEMWEDWDREDAEEEEEPEPEPDLSGNWLRDLVEGDDEGQEDESFDPYAGSVIFDRNDDNDGW